EIAAMRLGKGPFSPVRLQGVDDAPLYLANVQAFRDLVSAGPRVVLEWKSMRDFLMPGATPELRHHLELVEKLLSLKLVDYEWAQYKAHREWTPQGSPTFRRAVVNAERFYTAAEGRNGAMAQNLMGQLNGQPVALVTGGFHTASIAHILKANRIPFAVI